MPVLDESVNFVAEWSYVAYANMSLLKRIVPQEELDRAPWDTIMKVQRISSAYSQFVSAGGAVSSAPGKASYYGDLGKSDVPGFVEYSQMAEADIYGYVIEQWRSQFPCKGGQALWTLSSHGPVSSFNIIDWFGDPLVAYYSVKRANSSIHVMANTGFFSWGPGDMFKASVFALNNGWKLLKNARVTARILDKDMKPVVNESWTLMVPAGGYKSEAREVKWKIPSDTPESYFFLELTMKDVSGNRLSRQAYWLRVVGALADPEARKKWQSGAVAEQVTKTGPWLKPQIEGVAAALAAKVTSYKLVGTEARITLEVRNTGAHPAYPVTLCVSPHD